jgi:iron complex transport system substrate-binding protein
MRHFISLFIASLLTLLVVGHPALAHLIIDATGRQVEVPDTVARVLPAGPPAAAFLYALAPEKMLGWAHAPDGIDRGYIAEPYAKLPQLGALTSRSGEVDADALQRLDPELIVDVGTVSSRYIEIATRTQRVTGRPYILLDGRITALPGTMRTLAGALGVETRGEALASYAEKMLADVRTRLAAVPPDRRLKVYYGRGKDGLTTAGAGSISAEFIDLLNLDNVAPEHPEQMYAATPEQIRAWNPDIIVMLGQPAAQAFRSDRRLKDLARSKQFFVSPTLPFGWVDGPPSPSRLLALWWLGGAIYPEVFSDDIRNVTRTFYHLFYQVDLTDAQLDEILR